MDKYFLNKWLWTEADFESMCWHDSVVYAIKVNNGIYFDLDYIFEWVQPFRDPWLSFWVAPCTLFFETPARFSFNLESTDTYDYLEIANLHRHINERGKTEWRIETHIGDILIEAASFRQIVRRPPTLQTGQQILPEERGEVSFGTVSDTTFTETSRVSELKKTEWNLREKAKEVIDLQNELSNLFENRAKGVIEVKQYILKKRSIEQKIAQRKKELMQSESPLH